MKDKPKNRNYVHKYMEDFNKPKTHRDRKNEYQRKPKHKPDYTKTEQ